MANARRPGDDRGPLGYLKSKGLRVNKDCPPSQAFSVWRPTGTAAQKLMVMGYATGKGLNIKGKSAKTGVLASVARSYMTGI